jgi:hypothetical protein
MASTTCPECKAGVTSGAGECPECGHPIASIWGKCPECKGVITPTQESCKECGFPLRPTKRSVASPASPSKGATGGRKRKRPRGRPLLEPAEEPQTALIFAVIGLVFPVFAFLALSRSRPGSGARRLAWIGIALWIPGILLFALARK